MKYTYTHSFETYERLHYYSNIITKDLDINDIFCELCWIIYNSGFKYEVVKKYWPFISREFLDFNVVNVSNLFYELDSEALKICKNSGFNNMNKVKWCIYNAYRMLELDMELIQEGGLMNYFISLSKTNVGDLINDSSSIVKELGFKGIGNVTIFHLFKNIGIDIFKPDIHVCRLLHKLGLINNVNAPVNDIADAMNFLCSHLNTKLYELDTIFFDYGRLTNDSLAVIELH